MLLRELFEEGNKTAVLAFGRMNPPTIGHAKLVEKIKSIPGDHFLFLSHSQDRKKDPLDFNTKLKFAKAFFPGIEIGREGVNTPVAALQYIQSLGYNNVVFVAGSDRVEGFQKLFDTYNGTPDKSGKIPFQFDGITVVSAGERDPDADGAEGMSASKMRAAAVEGNFDAFKIGTPDSNLAQKMYDAVRTAMGVAQPVTEVFNTKAINAKWSGSGDMTAMEFTASNGIEYKIDFVAPYIGPDEIHPTDFIPNLSDELVDQSVFIEFEQKGATGKAKQGVAGTGAASEVFGIVTNAILEFVNKRKPPMIYFQAAELNRRKLYAAIVNKLVKSMPGWAAMSKDGHFALYQKSITSQNESVDLKKNETDLISAMEKFLPIAMQVLDLKKLPKIKPEKYIAHKDQPSFGRFVNNTMTIHLGIENRHPIDILRTLAHELVHFKQLIDHKLDQNSGETGSPEENEAHVKAGIILRLFNKKYPNFFKEPAVNIDENFADGKVKGKSRPGRVKRAGASCKGSVTDLRRRAKVGGERGKMYHWCANMKSGKK